MDDKKSLVIIGFLVVIIIALASFFLFLVTSGPSPAHRYMAQNTSEASETVLQTEAETQLETAQETKERETQTRETDTHQTVKQTEAQTRKETEEASFAETVPETLPQDSQDGPTVGEVIPCSGILEIIQAGDYGEGIVFHAKPQFDSQSAPGNVLRKEGTYYVDGKIYVEAEDGKPYLMYRTEGYYVTSNPAYVSYTPDEAGKGLAQQVWIREYANDEGQYVKVYTLDDSHVVFDTGTLTEWGEEAALKGVIGTFIGSNKAEFSYTAADGDRKTGSIAFQAVPEAEGVYQATVSFQSGVWYPGGGGTLTQVKTYN